MKGLFVLALCLFLATLASVTGPSVEASSFSECDELPNGRNCDDPAWHECHNVCAPPEANAVECQENDETICCICAS